MFMLLGYLVLCYLPEVKCLNFDILAVIKLVLNE